MERRPTWAKNFRRFGFKSPRSHSGAPSWRRNARLATSLLMEPGLSPEAPCPSHLRVDQLFEAKASSRPSSWARLSALSFGGIRTRADPGTDPRWIGLCTSQGQEGRAPSRAEQSAGAASSGSDGAARHEGQRALPRARRNQGDDLPLRSARWFLEKPRATGPGSLGGPKSGP